MELKLLTKENIKQIIEFPNDIKKVLIKNMSEEQVDKIMKVIRISKKEDINFLIELNKSFKTINEDKFKLVHFMSSYFIKRVVIDKKELKIKRIAKYDDSLESKMYIFLFSKFAGKKYTTEERHKHLKEWLIHLIDDSIENGSTIGLFSVVTYINSYKHWLLLMDTIIDVLTTKEIVKLGE